MYFLLQARVHRCTLVASDTNSLSLRVGKGGALMNLNIFSAGKYGIFDSSTR